MLLFPVLIKQKLDKMKAKNGAISVIKRISTVLNHVLPNGSYFSKRAVSRDYKSDKLIYRSIAKTILVSLSTAGKTRVNDDVT